MTMMSLRDAAMLIPGATILGATAANFSTICTDSRSVGPGDLFVALAGDRFDAHQFLPQVAERGASAVLVSRVPENWPSATVPALLAADTRLALGDLARGWRRRFAIPVVAVTGSNGKTTVKEMIAAIFKAAVGEAHRLATRGNFNNDIGLPLTLLRLRATDRLAVVELGMNHPGETRSLAGFAEPTVALINNAQREHQEFMASVEAVAREHVAVIEALAADGVAVFPADDTYASIWRAAAGSRQVMDFALSADESSGLNLANLTTAPQSVAVRGLVSTLGRLRIDTPQGSIQVALKVLGQHNARNALAACAAALAAGVGLDAIAQGLESFEPVNGRLQVKRAAALNFAGAKVIDDTYNANPDSMRAAIDVLAEAKPDLVANADANPSGNATPARLLVIGDMGEVGTQGAAFHREVGAYARARGITGLFGLGPHTELACAAFGPNAAHFETLEALVASLLATRLPGISPSSVTVLVKGSRFMRMERVVAALVDPDAIKSDATGPSPVAH